MAASPTRKHTAAKSRYLLAALLLAATVLLFGWVLNHWITDSTAIQVPGSTIEMDGEEKLSQMFNAAVGQMQQGRYRQALDLWHKALLLEPNIPEIKVNMGFSLYELGEYATARDAFINAIEQNAYQANAYYGLAITSEKMGDLEGALGAMRSYIHLASAGDDDRYIRRARSALWEWETQLAERAITPVPEKAESQPADQ
jgi:tetratricopeptide (TPR) repeat protein